MRLSVNKLIALGLLVTVLLILTFLSLESVSQGTVKSGYLFGKHIGLLQPGGPYFVHPLASWKKVDTKEKTLYLEDVPLPSQDQLISTIDISIQYRAIGAMANVIVSGTGSEQEIVDVHLVPNTKNLLRQAGRSIEKAEQLFDKTTVDIASAEMLKLLAERLQSRGFEVTAVLFRNIEPPNFIKDAIQRKKEREQLAEQQKAELERFKTEQQQKIASAQAELDAAGKEAEKICKLADAKAYEISKITEAAAKSPVYLQLEAVKALGALGNDPSTKLIIMDGSSAQPFPFLNLGETEKKIK